jgi:hypothetical protein
MPGQAASALAGGPGVADVGHEIPPPCPNLLTATLGAPASVLGLIEDLSDGLGGAARLAGGALADDPHRRRALAVGGYTTTAALSGLIGAATTIWQVGVLRAGAWAVRGLRVGNLLDRAVDGIVTDLTDLGWWPIFNLADAGITIGALLLLVRQRSAIATDKPARASTEGLT